MLPEEKWQFTMWFIKKQQLRCDAKNALHLFLSSTVEFLDIKITVSVFYRNLKPVWDSDASEGPEGTVCKSPSQSSSAH